MRPKARSAPLPKYNLFENLLLAASLKANPQAKYSAAVLGFAVTLPYFPNRTQELDDLIPDYILIRFRINPCNGERSKMGCRVGGFPALYPSLKGQMPKLNSCLSGWDKLFPSQSSMPLTRDLMKAFVVTFIKIQEEHCAMAIALA